MCLLAVDIFTVMLISIISCALDLKRVEILLRKMAPTIQWHGLSNAHNFFVSLSYFK